MHSLVSTAVRIAHADVPVLISGPNGAGKEIIADIVQANSTATRRSVDQGQRRRAARHADGSGTVRHRGRRLHRRQGAHRALRGRGRRHDLPRRDSGISRRSGRRSSCACCRPANSSASAPTHAPHAGARDRRDQLEPAAAHPRGEVPRGPLLPPERDRARGAGARGPAGRHPAARAPLPRARVLALAGRRARAQALPLARQRPRTAKCDPPRLPAVGGQPVLTAAAWPCRPCRSGAEGAELDRARSNRPCCWPTASSRTQRVTSACRVRHSIGAWRSSASRHPSIRAGHPPATADGPQAARPPLAGRPHRRDFRRRGDRRHCASTLALPHCLASPGWRAARPCSSRAARAWLAGRVVRGWSRSIRAVTDGISSLQDHDFSISVTAIGADEIGDLTTEYNTLGDRLRRDRLDLHQRELLLDTVVQTTPLALVLTNPDDMIVFGNIAARQLFRAGPQARGLTFRRACWKRRRSRCARRSRRGADTLFTIDRGRRGGHLPPHEPPLRAEQPAAPAAALQAADARDGGPGSRDLEEGDPRDRATSSTTRSRRSLARALGAELALAPDPERLARVFSTIEERASHLATFIDGYARFAKLPRPRPRAVRLGRAARRACKDSLAFRVLEPRAAGARPGSMRRRSSRC